MELQCWGCGYTATLRYVGRGLLSLRSIADWTFTDEQSPRPLCPSCSRNGIPVPTRRDMGWYVRERFTRELRQQSLNPFVPDTPQSLPRFE